MSFRNTIFKYTCTHTHTMATKTITIMEEAYEALARRKLPQESFSDVIRRITKKRDIMEFAGAWKHFTDDDIKEMKENIAKARKYSRESLRKKIGVKK